MNNKKYLKKCCENCKFFDSEYYECEKGYEIPKENCSDFEYNREIKIRMMLNEINEIVGDFEKTKEVCYKVLECLEKYKLVNVPSVEELKYDIKSKRFFFIGNPWYLKEDDAVE